MLPYLGLIVFFPHLPLQHRRGAERGRYPHPFGQLPPGSQWFCRAQCIAVVDFGKLFVENRFPAPAHQRLFLPDLAVGQLGVTGGVYASLLANLGLLAVGIHGLLKRKVYGFGPLWYFVSVSIFTSLVITNVSAYNDRFLYVPVLGIVFLLVWGISKLIKQPADGQKETAGLFFKNNFVPVALVALLGALGIFKIESHLPVWKDRYALFEHDVQLAPQNARMRKNYGGSFARMAVEEQQKDQQLAQQYARQAIEQLDYALSLYPNMATGHIHKGNMHIILKQNDKAIAALQTALKYSPSNYYAKASLGNVQYRNGDYEGSVKTLESIPIRLRNKADWDVLARSYERLGNAAKAAEARGKM